MRWEDLSLSMGVMVGAVGVFLSSTILMSAQAPPHCVAEIIVEVQATILEERDDQSTSRELAAIELSNLPVARVCSQTPSDLIIINVGDQPISRGSTLCFCWPKVNVLFSVLYFVRVTPWKISYQRKLTKVLRHVRSDPSLYYSLDFQRSVFPGCHCEYSEDKGDCTDSSLLQCPLDRLGSPDSAILCATINALSLILAGIFVVVFKSNRKQSAKNCCKSVIVKGTGVLSTLMILLSEASWYYTNLADVYSYQSKIRARSEKMDLQEQSQGFIAALEGIEDKDSQFQTVLWSGLCLFIVQGLLSISVQIAQT